jgi:hypothetical protein
MTETRDWPKTTPGRKPNEAICLALYSITCPRGLFWFKMRLIAGWGFYCRRPVQVENQP